MKSYLWNVIVFDIPLLYGLDPHPWNKHMPVSLGGACADVACGVRELPEAAMRRSMGLHSLHMHRSN